MSHWCYQLPELRSGLTFRPVGLLCALLVGCTTPQERVCQALRQKPPSLPAAAATAYRVGCPDVLHLQLEGRPELSGQYEVQPNGCIDLGSWGGVRVEGLTTQEIEARLGKLMQLDAERVQVRVVKFCSQHVYLFGQVAGQQRAIPYAGPEPVTELLRRAGGLTGDGSPTEVRVVRHPATGGSAPEVYRVDLRAILLEGDPQTNLIVQPYDHIYVPETRRARIGKCLPPWLCSLGKLLSGRWPKPSGERRPPGERGPRGP